MADSAADDGARKQAIKRIKRKRQFQQQIIGFVLINALLWIIWALTGAEFPWPIFVTVFWGIGMLGPAWTIYRGNAPITDAEIQREMQKGTDAT